MGNKGNFLAFLRLLMACITLLFGNNLYERFTGKPLFPQASHTASTPANPSTVSQTSETIIVDSTRGWMPSPIYVVDGCQIEVKAFGEWSNGSYTDGKRTFRTFTNADGGNPIESSRFTYPLPNTTVGTLVAKIGSSGQPFKVGSRFGFENIQGEGKLYFSINDDFTTLDDNLGQLRVLVEQTCPSN